MLPRPVAVGRTRSREQAQYSRQRVLSLRACGSVRSVAPRIRAFPVPRRRRRQQRQNRTDPGSSGTAERERRGLLFGTPREDEDPLASVGCADVGSGNSDPLRVIPEVGKVSKYGAECPQYRLLSFPAPVSQTPRARFHVAIGSGMEETSHVFDEYPAWA